MEVLQHTSHPRLMQSYRILHDEKMFYIVTEICEGGELYQRISNITNFCEMDGAYVIKQLLQALAHLHMKNVIHRDMKPENVLMVSKDKKNFDIKLADFGFARFVEHNEKLNSALGSPFYIAPEMLSSNSKYDCKVDVWALGVMTYELLSGNPPFDSE